MYWKLTENIWWGDRHSVEELKDEVGSVLNLAHNEELSPRRTRYNPLVLGGHVPYFRLGAHDRTFLTDTFLRELDSLLDICLWHLPMLIHCYEGKHRSPIVAVWAATKLSDYSRDAYKAVLSKAIALHPDFMTTLEYNYSISVQRKIESKIRDEEGFLASQAGISRLFQVKHLTPT